MKRNIPEHGRIRNTNATVRHLPNGIVRLTSYTSVVADYDSVNDKVTLYTRWDYSVTTRKHVREFLINVLGACVSIPDVRKGKYHKVSFSDDFTYGY